MARPRQNLRGICEILEERRVCLPPHDHRIRDGQAAFECRLVHSDWIWETHQRPLGGTPARQTMAAAAGHVSLGNYSPYLRRPPLQSLYVWLPLFTAAGTVPHG